MGGNAIACSSDAFSRRSNVTRGSLATRYDNGRALGLARLRNVVDGRKDFRGMDWAVWSLESARVAEPEIGWAVRPRYQGRGYAKEAATKCLDYAVDSLGWQYLAHFIDKDNVPSIRLAERLGASWHREEVPPPPIEGLVWQVYRQTADSWKNRPVASTQI